MFIFTTKFNRKKALLAVVVLAVILIAIILIAGSADRAGSKSKETAALSAVVKNNDQRVKYLNSLGWEVEKKALEEQKVVIPRDFSDVYKKYNEIQLAQGFDLSKYGGVEATRYTYKVLNYPDCDSNVVADIIIYRNHVIAGDIQSNAMDGFMVGLKYPKPSVSPSAEPAPTDKVNPNEAAPTAANPNEAAPTVNAVKSDAAAQEALTSDTLASEEETFETQAP
jgi:hypothetical protein